ncbi:zinc finger CCCH domain-containing protein 7-like isoform X1 [Papaver somniferum]|uniref:zinc finger CCCH domain-containing protein 7-like isoform X1 n=1 Tax=Papaver somniferum TaxID=3469 RepID=UPI000E6F4929|nr:zinc finger CCCH domain-containing protein 7-like isoform X1 [Papaver somniferum]XP_026427001.1 zinc finger CCCH domain-containing protein 7-like isoform X1 [Papaver somniferum]XP_026427003.1 zinc finger CCCH domain-containing protein 7-like isoform X1 [Papaver somniferum]XP_026427004.1 zinc finger CCCH domain-containing protein 7-like isoform X1 [Papaver somniferum]
MRNQTLITSMGEVIFHSRFRHRRSHLKSKTVDTLLKIISLCADDDQEESQISSPIVSDALNSGVRRNDSENELVKDKNVEVLLGECEKLSIVNDLSVDDYSIENENLLTENVNWAMASNLLSDENVEPLGVEDSRILDGVASSVVKNCSDNNIEEPQQGNVDEIKVVDEHVTDEIREPIRITEDMQMQSSSSEQNVVNGVGGESQWGEMGLTEPVNLDSSIRCLTDMDIEDDEIPDGLGLYNEFVSLIHEGLAQNEEKSGGEDHIYYEVIKEREVENEHQDDTGAEENHMSSTCIQGEIQLKTNGGKLDRNLKRGYGDDLLQGAGDSGKENDEANVDAITKRVCLSDRNLKRGYGDDWLQEVGDSGRENSKSKAAAATEEVGLCNRKLERGYEGDWLRDSRTSGKGNGGAKATETTKKLQNTKVGEKRPIILSKEIKAKKKMNERKKRAQTRKEQGVKRLRIEPPISKPKVPKYCEFYLKGICQKRDSCKFSHDTTPLTKSQPCKFLALQQCLKGDDCPFDHQLAKYPCSNYATSGSCFRGDKCLFSHKIGKTSKPYDVSPTEAVSQPLPNNLNSKSSLNTKNISPCTLNIISSGASLKTPSSTGNQFLKNPEQSVLGKLRPPAQPPKGVTLLSFSKTPPNNSSNKADSNSTEASTRKDQESLKPPPSLDELFQKNTTSTPSSASQYSQNPLQNVQNKNSAKRAPSSTLNFAAKYESEMKKNRSKTPTGLSTTNTTTDSSKTPTSTASSSIDNIQNRLLKASPLLQEFLFGFGGTDGKL